MKFFKYLISNSNYLIVKYVKVIIFLKLLHIHIYRNLDKGENVYV